MENNATETPAETLETATEQARLPLNEISLIGIYHRTDDAPLALIRLPSGQIETAVPGARVAGRRILAIREADLIFEGPAGPAEVMQLLAA